MSGEGGPGAAAAARPAARDGGGPAGPGAPAGGSGATAITVNTKRYEVDRPEMTAREIKDLAGAPLHHMLIHVAGGPGGPAGGGDEPMADADAVRLARGMRFRTVNSATFGSQGAAAHLLPPLLLDHIGRLESMGYEVEVTAGDAIYVVIREYPIPGNVWDRSRSDLMIMAHDTYPNAPLDMFWLDPPISRRSGEAASGVGTETRNGRKWQSFSWHIGGWDPVHDNLVTYLDVVNDRLRRDA